MRRHAMGSCDAGSTQNAGRSRRLTAAALLALGCWLAFGVAGASAATSYKNTGEFGHETMAPPGFESVGPTKIAVDNATGNVLVADYDNNRVVVFDSAGPSAVLLAQIGVGELSKPYGVAVDQTSHAVYVADSGNNRIVKYTGDGAPTPTYTFDASFTSPAQGSAAGQVSSFASAIAVDPTNGNLLVADASGQRVSRFTSSGSSVSSFDGTGSAGGVFLHPVDLAVDAGGDIYVIDLAGEFTVFGTVEGTTRLERFGPTGTPKGPLGALVKPRSIAVDTKSGNVIVATQSDFGGRSKLHVFQGGALLAELTYPANTENSAVTGLSVDGGASGRLYALTAATFNSSIGYTSVQVYDTLAFPDVTINAPSSITTTSAHFSGTVNPLGQPAKYKFEYSGDGGETWSSTPELEAGEGNLAVEVSADVAELPPNSEFLVRLTAKNEAGSFSSQIEEFSTLAAVPAVVTKAATNRTTTGATLHGTVNPFGLQSTYHFEYGLTTAYGSRVPVSNEGTVGDGRAPLNVAHELTGLQPETTYHFRLVASNSVGEAFGADRSFTVAATGAPTRAYEMVSPVEKGAANVYTVLQSQGSRDGESIAYFATTPLPGLTKSAPGYPRYVATRSSSDWSSVGVDPPQLGRNIQLTSHYTEGISQDGTKALVISLEKLADGGVSGDSNIYLEDLTNGTFTTVATLPGTKYFNDESYVLSSDMFVEGTPDFSHVLIYAGFFGGEPSLLPGAPKEALYDFSNGELSLVSVAADGTPFGHIAAGTNRENHEMHVVSEDGAKVYFAPQGNTGPVFVRVDGSTTRTIGGTNVASATADGRFALIVGHDLTGDSPPGQSGLYRYDFEADQMTRIATGQVELNQTAIAADGNTAYFLSPNGIEGENAPTLYVWRGGQVHRIATVSLQGEQLREWRMSPSGDFFVFASYKKLTEYDNSSTACTDKASAGEPGDACREIYRYDAEAEEITCASCRPDSGMTTGNARIAVNSLPDIGGPYFPRSILDDGRVFFDTPDSLTSKDSNSQRDVYEFDGEEATLISGGRDARSEIADVSLDGKTVFFTTNERLVGVDKDDVTDLYSARVGGGLASQNPPAPQVCVRDDCKETPSAGPELPFGGSEGLTGPGNVKPPVKKCRKGTHTQRSKGKTRCVKNHGKGHKGDAGNNRRNAR